MGADLRLAPAAASTWAGAGWAVARDPADAFAVAAVLAVVAVTALVAVRLSAAGARSLPSIRLSDAAARSLLAVRSGSVHRRRAVSAALALAAACGALGVCSAAAQSASRQTGLVAELRDDGATTQVLGEVRSSPRLVAPDPSRPWDAAPRWTLRLRLDHVQGRGLAGEADAPVLVVAGEPWDDLVVGQRVRATGRLAPVDAGDDVVALLLARGNPLVVEDPGHVDAVAGSLRAGLRAASEGLPPDARGLLPGLVVGDTSLLPPDLEQDMRDTGLTHLTAVSGSNITIVCGAALLVAATFGLPRRSRVVAAAAALAGFVVLAGPEPSVLRAGVMGAVGLVGVLASRRGAGMPALCGAVVLLVAIDPWLSRAYGFALSVLATGGLLLLARPWAVAMSRVMPKWLALAVAVPLAAQAVCGPVTIMLAPQVPLTALPANLLVAPAVAPATVLGVAATMVAPLWPPGAVALAWLAGWAVRWIAVVARTAADVPGARLEWPAGVPGAVLLALVTALGVLVVAASASFVGGLALRAPSRHVQPSQALSGRTPRPEGRSGGGASSVRGRRLLAVSVVAVCALVLALTPVADPLLRPGRQWPPPGWRLVACDVGQGDALVVRTGPGSALVVDAGPAPEAVDGCLDRLDVTHVDLLVLSHFHADHVDGLTGVLDGRQVDRALVSPEADPARTAADVGRALHEAGVAVQIAQPGQREPLGEIEVRVLWPDRPGRPGPPGHTSPAPRGVEQGSLANDASVVLAVSTPELSLLTTGDVEPPAQRGLLAVLERPENSGLAAFDVVKVAHHGSAHQWPALYERVAPRVALLSAGADNDYGHPSPEALEMLQRLGTVATRTDLDGDVAVGVGDEGLWTAARTR